MFNSSLIINNLKMKIFFNPKILAILTIILLFTACEKAYFPQPPRPKVSIQTADLEASYATTPPITLANAYWKTADYIKVTVGDLNTKSLYPDGLLNMTGTYNGINSFNNGKTDPNVIMKAAYDDKKVYLYIEWTDNDYSPNLEASILNGPSDPLKTDNPDGWTSQGNSDKVSLAFDISGATSAAGTFAEKGCAASCHNGKMQPASGSVDLWNWDLAVSEPLGYAKDMITNATTGLDYDAGTAMMVRNKVIPGDPRSAPMYEWDGSEQRCGRPFGDSSKLDPAYYLYKKTAFIGDIVNGDMVYHNETYGCFHCHGEHGEGDGPTGEGTAFANIGFAAKWSRAGIKDFSGKSEHTGFTYWAQVPTNVQDDMIAYMKALGSIPGYYLVNPTGSQANIWTVSNVTRGKINTFNPHTVYKVLLVRDLTNANSDDIQFASPEGKSYPFGIALMDNDGKNHIGSLKQTLTFKSK